MIARKKTIIFLVGICLSHASFSQNNGFLGKKNIISLDTRLYIPIIYNLFQNNEVNKYKAENGKYASARNLLTSGFNFAVGRTLSNKVAFHIQGSVLNYKINRGDIGYFFDGTFSGNIVKSTYYKGRAVGIMPIIEFAANDGITPVGLTHQIGFGFYSHRPRKEDYLLTYQYYDNSIGGNAFAMFDQEEIFDYSEYRIRSQSLMYKLNLRLPLSRSILMNIGFRYNLNFTQGDLILSESNNEKIFSLSNYRNFVRSTQANNIMSLETGFSFMF